MKDEWFAIGLVLCFFVPIFALILVNAIEYLYDKIRKII
jgi:hypothetical protein